MLIKKSRIIARATIFLLAGVATIATSNDNENKILNRSSPLSRSAHKLTVLHEPTPAPTYLDMGEPGNSVGDMRIWHFSGKTESGDSVVMEWNMTTTRIDNSSEGVESRVTLGVFSFTDGYLDQVLIQGVGLYPSSESTFKPDSSLTRAIIGGTGKFKGAIGEVVSTHLVDGTWQHVFLFSKNFEKNNSK